MAIAMVILPKFRREGNTFFADGTDCTCPRCKTGKVIPVSRCKRKLIEIDGDAELYEIPVGQCQNSDCARYHRMLPSTMVPYKHYSAEAIDGTLHGFAENNPFFNLSAPSASTIRRWKAWLISCAPVLIGFLVNVFGLILYVDFSSISNFLSSFSKNLPNYWFESFMMFYVNSYGGSPDERL